MGFKLPELTYPLYIDTIGKVLAHGDEISFTCYSCHEYRRLNLVKLAKRYGMDYSSMEPELLQVVFCPTCKARGWHDRNIGFTLHANAYAYSAWPQDREIARRSQNAYAKAKGG